ncbi:MAG: hypothetical protein HY318_05510, partial [Armatimonadetes bacterium]|nr:hypothetical protein [Armatimonadota bacterium]
QVRLLGHVGPEGGRADVYLDGEKQLVPIDCWNPSPRYRQVIYYRNGLSQGSHTLKVVCRGASNPYSRGTLLYIDAVQYSNAAGHVSFPSGSGPRKAQRMIFGYTGREDYRDSLGHYWRPGTEFVVRLGAGRDPVKEAWWTKPVTQPLGKTRDPELYRYGIHGQEFWVNVTVGPGRYHLRMKFAATHGADPQKNCFHISLNGRRVVKALDVAATAGGPNRAVDLVFNNVEPRNGVIEVRFAGAHWMEGDELKQGEAFVQALEVGPGPGGRGASPVSAALPEPSGNLLLNAGFEETANGVVGVTGTKTTHHGWTYEFTGPMQSYVWQEADYIIHPDWGLPELHSGRGAIRTHSEGDGHTIIDQEVDVQSDTEYLASVWVRAVDLHGKGFGKDPQDSAGLAFRELDKNDRLVMSHDKLEVKQAGPYLRLSRRFTTRKTTTHVRFVLDTAIRCPYTEGHVTYDDACLVATRGM